MPTDRTQLLHAFLDGTLPPELRAEAERLLERDPDALTLLDDRGQLETFISRVREALAMPNFPDEQKPEQTDAVREAVLRQVPGEASSLNLADPSVTTDSQAPTGETVSLAFLSPPQAADEIGRLNGYRILRELGHGGMGLVFAAEDMRLKRRVALKVMKPEVAARQTNRERFLREAITAAAVEHDHICPIYQVGEDNGVPFIAMPFLKGEPLDAVLKRQRVSIPEAVRIARQTAEGLAAAHSQGLIHRDIKPANIWLEAPRGRVRILDFGLARLQTEQVNLTQSGSILGTPAYMAPEQARGRPLDHRADLFSLGCVLYEMTTGRRPFTGPDTMAILSSLALDEPDPPHAVNPQCPPALSALTMELLAKTPDRRPATADVVAHRLGQLELPTVEVLSQTAVTPPAGDPWSQIADGDETIPVAAPGKPLAASPSRRKLPLVAVALALVIVIGGGGFGAYKLLFETKDGTLVVEVNDPEAEVRFKDGQLQLLDKDGKTVKYTLAASERNKALPPGDYQVRVTGADGVELDTKEFTLKKGGEWKVRVIVKGTTSVAKKEDRTGNGPFALLFNGAGRVEIPTLDLALDGPCTWEAVATLATDNSDRHQFVITNPAASLGINRHGMKWNFNVLTIGTSVAAFSPVSATRQRTHIAGVYDGGVVSIFVDGKRQDSQPVKADVRLNGLVNIGLDYAGTIESVRISKVARYDREFTPVARWVPDKDTIALYLFEEGADNVLKDSSGNGHHGKIVGAKWVKADGGVIEPKASPGPAPLTAEQRKALRWILAHGRAVDLVVGPTELRLAGPDSELPAGPCQVHRIHLNDCKEPPAEILKALRDVPPTVYAVSVENVRLRDTDLAELAGIPALSRVNWLNVASNPITDAGLPHLARMTAVKDLILNDTTVTAAGLGHLSGLRLTSLELRACRGIDDSAVEVIGRQSGLTNLYLRGTRVTQKGVQGLAAALPQCKITWDGGVIEPKPSADADRKAVLWVLSVGGKMGFQDCQVTRPEDLPAEFKWTNSNIWLENADKVTDAGLANVSVLGDRLIAFYLFNSEIPPHVNVTDAGLAHLKTLTNLRVLDFCHNNVSDQGLVHLEKMKNLEYLQLRDTRVGDAGMKHLKGLTKLTLLNLMNTSVGDDGLKELAPLKLDVLLLANGKVTDAGMKHLQAFPDLTRLDLSSTAITDSGLLELRTLKKLGQLDIRGTKVTEAGCRKLAAELPGCKIEYDGGVIEPTKK